MKSIQDIREEARKAIIELIDAARLTPGQLVIVGCSSSEMAGGVIGHDSHMELAEAVFEELYTVAKEHQINLAFQCCEHLNRAIVVERSYVTTEELCNVVPQQHAGGAMATTAYKRLDNPAVVEFIKADAGIDIGDTFIGMHLKHVAVPVRLGVKEIGCAHVTAARVRPKSIGGIRAVYNESLM